MDQILKGQNQEVIESNDNPPPIYIGLRWDPNENENKAYDLDLHAYSFDKDKNFIGKTSGKSEDINPSVLAIHHSGDSIDGEEDGDDEIITIQTDKIDNGTSHIIFRVSVETHQHFETIPNASIRIYKDSNEPLIEETLTGDFHSNEMVFCRLYKSDNNSWHLENICKYSLNSEEETWQDSLKTFIA